MTDHLFSAWTVQFHDAPDGLQLPETHFWSGIDDLDFEQVTWLGRGDILEIEPVDQELGQVGRRLRITMAVDRPFSRQQLLTDHGPIEITLGWILSPDGGVTWARVPLRFTGRLSKPVLRGDVYQVILETALGDLTRPWTEVWSASRQRQRFPGDSGFDRLKELSEGIAARFPP